MLATAQRLTLPGPIGLETGARPVSSGKQAVEMAAYLLPRTSSCVQATTAGSVELRSGAIWNGDSLLVHVSPALVYYMVGDHLYAWTGTEFAGSIWPESQLERQRHAAIVYLSQADVEILESLFAPWYEELGLNPARVGLFHHANRRTLEMALWLSFTALRLIIECRWRYSRLFQPLDSSIDLGRIFPRVALNASRDEIARFVARAIADADRGPSLTLGAIARVAGIAAIYVATLVEALKIAYTVVLAYKLIKLALSMPPFFVGLVMPNINYEDVRRLIINFYATFFARELVREGCYLSEPDAVAILNELIDDPSALIRLRDLQGELSGLIPLLDKLHGCLHAGG